MYEYMLVGCSFITKTAVVYAQKMTMSVPNVPLLVLVRMDFDNLRIR